LAPDLTWIRLLLGVVGTVVYFLVGVTVGQKRTAKESAPGIRAFQLWWFGLATLTLFAPLMKALDVVTGTTGLLTFRIFLLEMLIILLMLAVGGLLYYLVYVYTGAAWTLWPVALYVLVETAWLVTIIDQAHITGYGPDCPGEAFCYERDLSGTSASTILSLSLVLPILLATIAYFALFFRVDQRVQKVRVAMVAGSLALWFGSSLVASLIQGTFETMDGTVARTTLSQSLYWTSIVSPMIGLAASLVIYWAYNLRAPGEPRQATSAPRGESA